MKYLLDKNILSSAFMKNTSKRNDLCITQEVLDEANLTEEDISGLKKSGIHVLISKKKHLEKLKCVMTKHGTNLKLINLYLGTGTADVMMIAYILAEIETDNSFFPEKFTIITKDRELQKIAKSYDIPTLEGLD